MFIFLMNLSLLCHFKLQVQCTILRRVRVAGCGIRSAGHAGISPLHGGGHAGFSVVKSAKQFPDSHQARGCLILKEKAREGLKAYFLDTNQVRPCM